MQTLSTLFLKNLVYSGIHGFVGREKVDPQHFQVDLEMQIDATKAAHSDDIGDTYDYKHAREVVRTVIEDQHYQLIEKIAYQIASRVCEDSKVFEIKVTLTKLRASQNGMPGIVFSYKRVPADLT